ncbi:threonine/serine exporter family protein [Weissella cibaria]|uniref:threonine/serine exporter family protein n=1 Tax=Weissella cibaria TaxID=137591 RepID=UPI002A747F41|nr:threonine/serine exporter family protein [Weissella cibaria]MDY2520446.1 threonine/serine exporter family protein [Weissella cibaria]
MTTSHEHAVLDVCARIGRILLESGAETPRIEETVEIIGRTAGVAISCYVTLTAVFVSLTNQPETQLTKTKLGAFNLQKVDDINQLSREFSAGQVSFDDIVRRVAAIDQHVVDFNWPTKILGAGLVSVAPMLVFIADWSDLGLAFFIGIAGYLTAQLIGRKATATPYAKEVAGGFVIALLAWGLVASGIGHHAENMIVSAVMPLVPGVALTNSMREIMAGHMISGTVRALDALLIAAAIGGGVVLATTLLHLCNII